MRDSLSESASASSYLDDVLPLDDLLHLDPVTPANVPLPDDFFPACWHHDDARMCVLFAPFRSRSLNPLNYDNKLRFWTELIAKYCQHKGNASCTLAELRDAFRRGGKVPYALRTVLEEMQLAGQARPGGAFLEQPLHTWRGWAQKRLGAALVWPVQKVAAAASWWPMKATSAAAAGIASAGSPSSSAAAADGQRQLADNESSDAAIMQQLFVVLSVVEEQAQRLQRNEAIVGRVLDFGALLERQQERQLHSHNAAALTEDGLRLAVHHLYCTKRAAMLNVPGALLVKIIDGRDGSGSANDGKLPEITKAECDVHEVRRTVLVLQKRLQQLDGARDEADRCARELVRENKRALALVQLKKRKYFDGKIGQESNQLLNLEAMLISLEEQKDAAHILSAYKMAADALHQAQTDAGLTLDKVDDVMLDVQETLDEHNEMHKEIGGAQLEVAGVAPADEAALDAELAELMAQDKAQKEQKESDLNASIQRRLEQLHVDDFNDLSLEDRDEILRSVQKRKKVAERM